MYICFYIYIYIYIYWIGLDWICYVNTNRVKQLPSLAWKQLNKQTKINKTVKYKLNIQIK